MKNIIAILCMAAILVLSACASGSSTLPAPAPAPTVNETPLVEDTETEAATDAPAFQSNVIDS